MKKLVLTGLATLGFTFAAQAAANVSVDNLYASYGLAINTPENYFGGGAFSLEVWVRNGTSLPGNINNQSNPLIAHNNVLGSGFTLAATYHGNSADQDYAGLFDFQGLVLPSTTPYQATFALAAWNSSAATWSAATNGGATHGGVVTFVSNVGNPNTDPIGDLPPSMSYGFDQIAQDLVMVEFTPVPEPGTIALAGLGVAAYLITRRARSFANIFQSPTQRN